MEFKFAAVVGNFLKKSLKLTIILFLCIVQFNCASSQVSRDAASNVDMGMQNARSLIGTKKESLEDYYQNSSQTQKGVLLGAGAGTLVGTLGSTSTFPLASTFAILGGSYGAYIDTHASLADQLINRGISVSILGDRVLIIIPSSRLFYEYSNEIKPGGYTSLNLIANYIGQYTKTLVKVSAFTNMGSAFTSDLKLSQQQADSIIRYFTRIGLNARLLYGIGYGSRYYVSKENSAWDGNDNFRIEISLEKLYV